MICICLSLTFSFQTFKYYQPPVFHVRLIPHTQVIRQYINFIASILFYRKFHFSAFILHSFSVSRHATYIVYKSRSPLLFEMCPFMRYCNGQQSKIVLYISLEQSLKNKNEHKNNPFADVTDFLLFRFRSSNTVRLWLL